MTDDKPNILPIGKYKGRPVEEVLIDDPQYLQWLCGQDWFRAKFVNLYQVIINRGAAPEETPEHNALQVKFLDDEFCERFLCYLVPDAVSDSDAEFEVDGVDVLMQTSVLYNEIPASARRFFRFYVVDANGGERFIGKDIDPREWATPIFGAVAIEIKPIVGDDYPAVLRQMKANGSGVLLVERYTGTGATREQFIKTFATASIRVVFLEDVEAAR
jgi:hypothetical protein